MSTYKDYYKTRAMEFSDKPETVRMHLDHCIEILRLVLMCNADAGLLTYRWVKGHDEPFPNFNTRHRCRNFESLVEWAGFGPGRIARLPPGFKFKPMPGEKIWDEEP